MKQPDQKLRGLYSFILYALGFLLFWEWIKPLDQISDMGRIDVLLLFTLYVFLMSYLLPPAWLVFPLHSVVLLYVLHFIYFSGSFFDYDWLLWLIGDLTMMLQAVFAREWTDISDISRTFLFLFLLCLVGYMMKYWLLQTRNAFLFLFATIVYITVIDTFTVYDASMAIIRVVVLGLILVGLLHMARIQEKEGFGLKLKFPMTWVAFITVMIFSTSLIGFAAPKAAPQWPDPVPFIKNAANLDEGWNNRSTVSRIGYGTNDERLGGPFQMDDTPVFRAYVNEPHYWRAETKDIYTGKGWKSSDGDERVFHGVSEPLFEENVRLEEKIASVEMTGEIAFSFLFYPSQLNNVETEEQEVEFTENLSTGKISTMMDGEAIIVDQYTLTYDDPTFSIEALRESDGLPYPSEITNKHLQLPDSLPERVGELAEAITVDEMTAYDKAKAIERYFAGNGFIYDTQNVAVPGRNEDYVDQFLFETKTGYCDNFSTSMVVMLRSIGIPARWVKGFTEGEYLEQRDDGTRLYLVTNENAHSWVEAYFPGTGWVPFEPTKGFWNASEFVQTFEAEEEQAANVEKPEKEEDEQQVKAEETAEEQLVNNAPFSFHWNKWAMLAILAFIVVIGLWYVFKSHRKLLRKWVLLRFSKRIDDSAFDDAYVRLLRLLHLFGCKRKPQQTLREYAVEIDRRFQTNEMKQLTKAYEERLYDHKQRDSINWNQMQKLWINLLEKITS